MQYLALAIFLAWSAVTVAVFIFVARSGRTPAELPLKAYKRNRAVLLLGLVAVAVLVLFATLPLLPYPDEGVAPDRVVYVSAKQFAFKLSDKPISREDAMDDEVFLTIKPIRTGELVEFRVTAADVTHGFCIYNSAGRDLTQTQAMPGYVNRLRHRFSESGTYPVLCMELCGIGHPTMKAQLEVVDSPAPSATTTAATTAGAVASN